MRTLSRMMALIYIVAMLLIPAGRADAGQEIPPIYTSMQDIPGITEAEIQAASALREKYGSFTFGALGSTEAFYDENGEIRGYSALFCEWLTQLFGIEFTPAIYDWSALFPALKADFTGDLTATEERREKLGYLFTDAIVERSTRFFRVAGSPPRTEIIETRPLKLAFLEGSTTSKAAEAKLQEASIPYEAIFVNDYATAYQMIKSGEADAFIDEMVAEAAFDEMGDVIAEDFLPLIFEPVSLSTQNPELRPVIDIVQKVLENGGVTHFVDMYERGMKEYARHKLLTRLNAREIAYLRENTAVRYLAEFDNYPLSFYNENESAWQGIAADILTEISALTGLNFEVANEPGTSFSDLLKMLENGEGDMLSELIRNSEREGRFLWPENSTTVDHYAAVSLEKTPNMTVQRIMQLKVGVQKDSAYADLFSAWFPGHPDVVRYNDTNAAFDGLERGEVDILMCSTRDLLVATNYHEMTGFKTNIVFDYTFESLFGFNQNEAVLCSVIDKAMGVIDVETISSQWMRRTYDYRAKILESQRPYLIGAVVLFLTVVVLVFVLYMRNRSAGRQLDNLVKQRTSELDRSRRDLSAALQAAEGANRAKSAFLATMSHEIRTPMNAIIGMAEIALRGDIPDSTREHVFTIKQAGTNLLSIINDILDFSKIEAGKLEIVPADYMLTSLLNDAISIIRMRTVDSQVLFVVTVDCNIPDELYGDEVRIRQILLNLLSNAIKFTEEGYISFSVFGDTDGDTLTLTMSVADSGKGIRPEDIGKLFENFSQVDLAHNKGVVGTGLGLAITRNLARAMGGDVSVDSEYGKGSTFTVTLPQKMRSHHPLAAVHHPEDKQVLVYETRDIYANSIVCTIDNLGVECTSVSAADELRAEIETGVYNYIFIAAHLYEDVRELCGRLEGGVKIVLLAGFGEAIASRNLSILSMPAYSTSVANILNGVAAGSAYYNENNEATIRFTAPEANILIVDDIDTNLLVIQGLLLPYRMKITLCNSGFDAIEAMHEEAFDLIFMDHMMPEMDGIETVQRIRNKSENEGIPIVALTANAIAGAKQMFLAAGFQDYLSKPVDILKLDTILDKWIPKAKRQKNLVGNGSQNPKRIAPEQSAQAGSKLLAVFRRDAEKAAATLRETAESGDIKLFTTTAHAMKSALGAIGESEKAELAFALEKAGLRGDAGYIAAHAGDFIEILESFLPPPSEESADPPETDIQEDGELLARQLSVIQVACADYDETAAYAALNLLKEKPWNAETAGALAAMYDALYLHSDFEEAANMAEILLRKRDA